MSQKEKSGEKLIASNKKAFHDYFVQDRFEAGIVLVGTEVKSLRDGKANLTDSYVLVRSGEAFLFNAHISPYSHGNRENHEPTRTRKLLLNRKELAKLSAATTEKGLAVVPLRIYLKGGLIKTEIAIVRGKKLYDKRETAKQKEATREAAAAMKFGRR
jgi:SsrA-binding protein